MEKNSVEIVATQDVVCNGNSDTLGHPKIYLKIKSGETRVVCPYCAKIFISKDDPSVNE